ncbi:unnamed protein product [Effrenium voratum]|nr:unnamed protein product [Effrenium voratum]
MNGVLEKDPLRSDLDEALSLDWGQFRNSLQGALRFTKATYEWGNFHLKQPYGIFAETGRRLRSGTEVLDAGLVLVVEGGQWFWPPVRIGYVRQLPGTPYMLETVSVQPVLFRVRGFLREEECRVIIDMAAPNMSDSDVVQTEKHYRENDTDLRTSTQARLHSSVNPLLQELDLRISNLTRVDVAHNEEVQVLRYRSKEFYAAHTDNFDPKYYENTDFIDKGHRNRLLTVFWYLTNVSKGGETLFPRADGLPPPKDMRSCERGLKVRPEVGAVILWYSLRPNGNGDPNGLHAACPVEDGEKWSANYWVWNKPRDLLISLPDADVDEEYHGEQPVTSNHVSATFRNEHPFPVYLFWKPPHQAREAFMGEISPQAAVSAQTFPLHTWHIRMGADQSSELVAVQEIADQPEQVFVLSSGSGPDEL